MAEKLDGRMGAAEERLDGTIAYRSLVRYDAYGELSGHQSTSIALLDAGHSGVVLSSIANRETARLYCKQVHAGEGELELSPEEAEAVRLALAGEVESVTLETPVNPPRGGPLPRAVARRARPAARTRLEPAQHAPGGADPRDRSATLPSDGQPPYPQHHWGPCRPTTTSGTDLTLTARPLVWWSCARPQRDVRADQRVHGPASDGAAAQEQGRGDRDRPRDLHWATARCPPGRDPARHLRPDPARHAQAQDHPPRRVRPRRLGVPVLRGPHEPHGRPRDPALQGRRLGLGQHRRLLRAVQPPQGRPAAAPDQHAPAREAADARAPTSSSSSRRRRSRRRGSSTCCTKRREPSRSSREGGADPLVPAGDSCRSPRRAR